MDSAERRGDKRAMDENLEDGIIKKTADVLSAAGEVIAELKRRADEGDESYDGGDLLERVQVAQILVLVASGERSMKSQKEHEEFMAKLDERNREARKRVDDIKKRVLLPEIPTPRPSVQAVPAPSVPPFLLPLPPKDPISGELILSINRTKGGWTVDTFLDGDLSQNRCGDVKELTTALSAVLIKLTVKEMKEKG